MKNYVSKEGIEKKEILYTTEKGTVVKILGTPYEGKVEVVVVTPCEGGSEKGKIGKIQANKEIVKLVEDEKKRKEKELLMRCPGLDELLSSINRDDNHYEDFQKAMESGDGMLPSRPVGISPEEARKSYPEAAAYLKLLKLADANPASEIGYIRRTAGKVGLEKMRAGVSPSECLSDVMAEIENRTNTPAYNAHVAGL